MDTRNESGGQETGRLLVLFDDEASQPDVALAAAGLSLAPGTGEGGARYEPPGVGRADAVYLERLRVAVVSGEAGASLAALSGDRAVVVEPERRVFAITGAPPNPSVHDPAALIAYLTGVRDAAQGLIDKLTVDAVSAQVDESRATWGLQATNVVASRFSGRDVAVAILDTGVDFQHPDLQGRAITSRSFVPGQTAQDGNGHGTHVIGTACGPQEPSRLPRYGIAYGARIFAGKVLSDDGAGSDGQVLAGLNWAIASGCRVASLSLGSPTRRGAPYSRVFERAAQRALAQGTLIIAAAGNESRRDLGILNPVGHPANCPSIMAVAAVDSSLRVAFFSNQGDPSGGGQIDLAAPGVDVYSSFPMGSGYRVLSGTSMATPHVAGIAALLAEARPAASAAELREALPGTARRLGGAAVDVGAGLVQAP